LSRFIFFIVQKFILFFLGIKLNFSIFLRNRFSVINYLYTFKKLINLRSLIIGEQLHVLYYDKMSTQFPYILFQYFYLTLGSWSSWRKRERTPTQPTDFMGGPELTQKLQGCNLHSYNVWEFLPYCTFVFQCMVTARLLLHYHDPNSLWINCINFVTIKKTTNVKTFKIWSCYSTWTATNPILNPIFPVNLALLQPHNLKIHILRWKENDYFPSINTFNLIKSRCTLYKERKKNHI